MPSLGEELKKERESRGISLKEISNETKISLRLLEALEKDQLDILPGKFFNKAIIQSYAGYLGLDKDHVLNMYSETSHLQEQAQKTKQIRRETAPIISRRTKKFINFALVVIILSASILIIFFTFKKKEVPPPIEEVKPVLILQEEAPPVTEPLPKETEAKEINLEITFLEETWIQVYADSELQVDGIKYAGDTAKVKALDDILIHLGNAGGLTYTLNDKKGKAFGARGAVIKNIQITLENYKEYIAEEEEADPEIENIM